MFLMQINRFAENSIEQIFKELHIEKPNLQESKYEPRHVISNNVAFWQV